MWRIGVGVEDRSGCGAEEVRHNTSIRPHQLLISNLNHMSK